METTPETPSPLTELPRLCTDCSHVRLCRWYNATWREKGLLLSFVRAKDLAERCASYERGAVM